MKHQILTKALALTISLIALSGCGASKTGVAHGVSDLSSRNPAVGDSSNAALAECTPIPPNNYAIEGRLTSYYNPTNGNYVSDLIRLKFDRLPVNITTSTTHYIQMFRWYADQSGKKIYASEAVGFKIMNRTTKEILNDSALKVISKNTLQNLITSKGLGASVTLNNFFEKHILILEGMDLTFDAVSFVVYDSAQGTKGIATVDSLLPAFAASPNAYASTHPQSVLQQLHPYWDHRNENYTDEQYRASSMDYCIP